MIIVRCFGVLSEIFRAYDDPLVAFHSPLNRQPFHLLSLESVDNHFEDTKVCELGEARDERVL